MQNILDPEIYYEVHATYRFSAVRREEWLETVKNKLSYIIPMGNFT